MEKVEVTIVVTRDEDGDYSITDKETGDCVVSATAYAKDVYDHVHGSHIEVDPLEQEHNRLCDIADEKRKGL